MTSGVTLPKTTVAPLHWTPMVQIVPGRDEPPSAFLQRFCEANGWPSLPHFARLIGVSPKEVAQGRDLERLAAAACCPVAALAVSAPTFTGQRVTIGGQRLFASQLMLIDRRVCRQCLAEGSGQKLWWQIAAITYCPRHHVKLCGRCNCGAKLSWRDPVQVGCLECAFCPTEEGRLDASTPPLSFQDWCHKRLGAPVKAPPCPPLDEMELGEAIETVEALAALSLRGFSNHRPRIEVGDYRLEEPIEAAFAALTAGSLLQIFVEALDRLRETLAGHLPRSPAAILGWFDAFYSHRFGSRSTRLGQMLAQLLSDALGFPVVRLDRFDFVSIEELAYDLRETVPDTTAMVLEMGALSKCHASACGLVVPVDTAWNLKSGRRFR